MSLRFTKFDAVAHRAKATHNIDVASAIAKLPHDARDWQVTALFYAAVHLIQAYFAAIGSSYPQTHQDRDHAIIQDRRLRKIYNDYRELKQAAVASRYLCWPVNDFDVSEAKRHLAMVQAFIDNALATSEPPVHRDS
jgi:HEPN domain-containing protein